MHTPTAQPGPSSSSAETAQRPFDRLNDRQSSTKKAKAEQQQQRNRTHAQKALSNEKIVDCIVEHLYGQLLVNGREYRQAYLRTLTLVSKAWVEPTSKWLWMNPYFGTTRRASLLEQCLQLYPKRGLLVLKLIYGEGSNTDITDWPTSLCVPNILRSCPNVEIIGLGGLDSVDMEQLRLELQVSAHVKELRACDMMPEPWCFTSYLFDEVLAHCVSISRLRLYNLATSPMDGKPSASSALSLSSSSSFPVATSSSLNGLALPTSLSPQPFPRALRHVALNHCAMNETTLKNILHSSQHSLTKLYIEYPMDLTDVDLLEVLRFAGGNLKNLTVQGFNIQIEQQNAEGTHKNGSGATTNENGSPDKRFRLPAQSHTLVDDILEACPELITLNFPEARGSPALLNHLVGSKLALYSFSCNADFKPHHWLDAFKNPEFPKPASCRVYVKGWTSGEVKTVRVKAYAAGVNWLLSGATLTELSEEMGV